MAGSTTVTGNKGRRRKLAARSVVRYGWRKREARLKASIKRDSEVSDAQT